MNNVDKSLIKKVTLSDLFKMKEQRLPIACLTAYEASFARLIDRAMTDVILIGDSLGMVVQGCSSTIRVTVDDIVYHCRCVSRSVERALLIADIPFVDRCSEDQFVHNAQKIVQQGRVQMVKLETDESELKIIEKLKEHSIEVCAHIGLLPQKIYKEGKLLKVAKKSATEKQQLINHAKDCVAVGADLLLAECIPSDVAQQISTEVNVPLIGIGSGVYCDGQILVMHDVLGASEKIPNFAKDFLNSCGSLQQAFSSYVTAVKKREFPTRKH